MSASYDLRSPIRVTTGGVTPRRAVTPVRAIAKPTNGLQWFTDPMLDLSSPTSPASATAFSPNYYRSAAVFGPRDSTPRRQSPGPGVRRPTQPTTPTSLRVPPKQLKADLEIASSPIRATTPTSRASLFEIRRKEVEESVCSSNDLSLADSNSTHSATRYPIPATKMLQSAPIHANSFTAVAMSTAVRRTLSPTANRRWEMHTVSSAGRAMTPHQARSPHRSSVEQNEQEQKQQVSVYEKSPRVSRIVPQLATPVSRLLLQQFVAKWHNRYHENQDAYREGGYMTVSVGDVLKHRYLMMHKLGWGEFSTVWLAYDREAIEARHTFVAVKIAKCHNTVSESSKYEINLLRYLRAQTRRSSPLTQLLDSFEHHGNYGNHFCMVFPVHGSNLLCIIDQMKAKKRRRTDKEIQLVKDITASVLVGLADLEAVNVIHTDIKPENVLCAAPDPKVVQLISQFYSRKDYINVETQKAWEVGDANNLVCLADFGLSALLEPCNTLSEAARHVGRKKEFPVSKSGVVTNVGGTKIQTREYRAPEILFGTDFCPRSDVWSVGCMVYELITGDFLVDPKRKTRVEREMDIEHLAMIMQIIGPVPNRITSLTRLPNPPRYLANYFNEHGQFIYADRYRHYPRRSIAAELELFLEPAEAERAAQFIMSCFTYDPMERCHASDLIKHSWLRGVTI